MTPMPSRSPLLVFLLLGSGLFAVERWLAAGNDARRVVTVTNEQVDALRARWDAQWGRAPTGRELQGLIDEAVREEILYREALRMSLDRDDPIVRRRLAQKMTFMLEDNSDVQEPARREVEAYFTAHAERYREAARTTFQHVFLSDDGREDLPRDAAGLLQELRDGPEGSWRAAGDPLRAAPGVCRADRPRDRGDLRPGLLHRIGRPRGGRLARTRHLGARHASGPGPGAEHAANPGAGGRTRARGAGSARSAPPRAECGGGGGVA